MEYARGGTQKRRRRRERFWWRGVAGALQAKLTDFGLSLGLSGTSLRSQRTTRAGAGTLPYKAPEQFSRRFPAASEGC